MTATGHDVIDSGYFNEIRIIAVDPPVIPLGAKVHFEGIGAAIALDTGGRINGHIVDFLLKTKSEAINGGEPSYNGRLILISKFTLKKKPFFSLIKEKNGQNNI